MIPILNLLHYRNRLFDPSRKLFHLEDVDLEGSLLKSVIAELIRKSLLIDQVGVAIFPFRLGILYKLSGHVTPLMFEFNYESIENGFLKSPRFRIYCTDSRSFDVEDGEPLRLVILGLPAIHPLIELYSTGLDPVKYEEKINTIRQHSQGACSIYSLLDLEIMLVAPKLKALFEPNIVQLVRTPALPIDNNRTFQITKLPANMMFYTESIHGNDDDNRRGLRHYVAANPDKANMCLARLEHHMTFSNLFSTNGYMSIISALSQSESPYSQLQHALMSGHGDVPLNIGAKKLTLKSLCDWHERQTQRGNKQKAFMIDFFIAIFNQQYEVSHSVDEEILTSYTVTSLLKNGTALSDYAEKNYNFGPLTESNQDLNDIPNLPDGVKADHAQECIDSSDDQSIFDAFMALFIRVASMSPYRQRLLDQAGNDDSVLLSSPTVSRRNSPLEPAYLPPPPAVPAPKRTAFRTDWFLEAYSSSSSSSSDADDAETSTNTNLHNPNNEAIDPILANRLAMGT